MLVKSENSIMGTLAKEAVDAPHCDQHEHGADLASETPPDNTIGLRRIGVFDPQPRLYDKKGPFTVLKVCSYRFYREFIRINGMQET